MEWVILILLILAANFLEKVLKGQKGQGDEDTGEAEAPSALGARVEEWIAEEMGISMERRPRVERPAPGTVIHPREESAPDYARVPYDEWQERQRAREEGPAIEEMEEVGEPGVVSLDEWGMEQREGMVPLEQRAMRERGEAVSLERPRTPEDHERFHRRYSVPKPVATHQEFHRRYVRPTDRYGRRRQVQVELPDRPEWSQLERAIIWSEILGPPRGMRY